MKWLGWIFATFVTWDLAASVLLPLVNSPKQGKNVSLPSIPGIRIDNAFQTAKNASESRTALETQLLIEGKFIPSTSMSAEARHQRFTATNPKSTVISRLEEMMEQASSNLVNTYNLSKDQAVFGLPKIQLLQSPEGQRQSQTCMAQFQVVCNDSTYRTQDGSCNNYNNPLWGKAFTCFSRILPPDYDDGISTPRRAVSGKVLPNPRVISQTVHPDVSVNSVSYSHITMTFGQFTDHDLTLTPMTRIGNDNSMMQCCPFNSNQHPECFPIEIPKNDKFFSKFSQNCLNFVRSAACTDCHLGPRKQTNQLTAWLDASQIYGSGLNETNPLRLFSNGLMKAQSTNVGELLPASRSPHDDQCSLQTQRAICFQAGDQRVNEQPTLTAMHTIWLRQHNRIARELQKLNPSWSDEKVFQETRRIIGAQFAMVVYSQFLPTVLGKDYMDRFSLWVQPAGFTLYDPTVEGKTFSEFNTAAYRFGHTLIRNSFPELGSRGEKSSINLKDNFFFPFGLYDGELDPLLRGLYTTPAEQFDNFVVDAVRNHLYKERGTLFGMDLVALNLQRGRDHGLNSYTTYLDYFFNIKVNNFNDLKSVMPSEAVHRFSKVYESVHDIDLFSGGISEYPIASDSVVGPTFGTIIGMQYFHLKFGDRYYFEHGGQSGSFTSAQLTQIRTTTLGRVICANADNIPNIRPNLFTIEDNNNFPIYCGNLTELDLHYWQ